MRYYKLWCCWWLEAMIDAIDEATRRLQNATKPQTKRGTANGLRPVVMLC